VALKVLQQRDIGFGESFLKNVAEIADRLVVMDTKKEINFFHAERPGRVCGTAFEHPAVPAGF
jgi:hypothetical protein